MFQIIGLKQVKRFCLLHEAVFQNAHHQLIDSDNESFDNCSEPNLDQVLESFFQNSLKKM